METKEVIENGKKRILYRGNCQCCNKCWIYLDTGLCIYGGPFSGYEKIESKELTK